MPERVKQRTAGCLGQLERHTVPSAPGVCKAHPPRCSCSPPCPPCSRLARLRAAKIQNDLRILTERLARINDNLARKVASRNEYALTTRRPSPHALCHKLSAR